VGDRIAVDDLPEALCRERRLSLVVVGAPERLQDRRLARLEPQGTLEHDRGGAGVMLGEQPSAAPEQLVGRFALVGHGHRRSG
jgi:hypothetical protein